METMQETQTKIKNEKKILIVDDNPKNLQVLGSVLRTNDYNVEFSTNGAGALHWIENNNFDLLLLDVMMPEMDGFEVCKRIRAQKSNEDLPIIFLTAKTDKDSIVNGFKHGAQDYVTKPFDAEELLARVNTQLELKYNREKLKSVNRWLEQKVEERTKELANANKELQELDEVKTQFLNMISHEIRTPLNGISGPLQLLKIRTESEDLMELIRMLDISVDRLEQFSYTALLITRLKAKRFRLVESQFNFKELLDHCFLKFGEKISKKKIEIDTKRCEEKFVLTTDRELLYEAIVRLIDNAVRFSPDNGNIYISGDVLESNDRATIVIEDTGNGFPKSILNNRLKLFNPGETFVNKNVGVNLYLVNLIMDTLGGSFSISNASHGGAMVKLTLKY